MGFNSDWQKMAYVLKPGEREVPAGPQASDGQHQRAPGRGDADLLPAGRLNTEVFDCAMAAMKRPGADAIDLLPSDRQPGPRARRRRRSPIRRRTGRKPLRLGSYISIELNTATPVARMGRAAGVRDDGGRRVSDGAGMEVLRAATGGVVFDK